jgi:hypothetical protein
MQLALASKQCLALKKQKERERRRRQASSPALDYRFDPSAYIQNKLGWLPWSGDEATPGQQQILDAYTLALRQLHERDAWEKGELLDGQLKYWTPGEPIQNVIRVEAGHTTGKTCIAAGIVNHFFDCFTPCVGYCFAPSWEQIHDLLFKEIKKQRAGKGLPGRILDLELQASVDHFIKGRATSNANSTGTERVQGQHGRYNLYVLDEAEGVADFVFDAIRSMTSGGISIVLMLANPRTRSSRFHKIQSEPHVRSFRMSCLQHPNVVQGREIVPGAVRRQYVEEMLAAHCQEIERHEPDNYTFEIPWRPGVIYEPDAEFLFRVLGIAPANISDKTLVPLGRYEAALKRKPVENNPHQLRYGVDVARFGNDHGTLYRKYNGAVRRVAKLTKLNTLDYAQTCKADALKMKRERPEITSLHFRVDGGGGFGGGVIDNLKADSELRQALPDFKVFEIHFNGTPRDEKAFADWITEATADVAESLKTLAVVNPPNELQGDLTEREYEWVNKSGVAVKKLEQKEKFRKRQNPERSPDDGDGFVLACVSDHLVNHIGAGVAVRQFRV